MNNPYSLTTDEQELFQPLESFSHQALLALCEKAHTNETTFPLEIYRELSKLGIAGISIDETYGGLKCSPRFQAALFDQLSQIDLGPAIFCSVHGMVSGLINSFADESQKKRLLPKLASGEQLAAFALSETGAGSDASNLSCSIQEQSDGSFLLNGDKCWITSAGAAHIYIVFARVEGTSGKEGITALLVPGDQEGLVIGASEKKMGCELSPIGTLTFSNATISKESIIGEVGAGIQIAYGGLVGGRINIAACANGLSTSALKKTVEYVKTRKQFGKALGEFQGLQFKLAEMKTRLDASILLVREAALKAEEKPHAAETRMAAAEAKYFATDTAMFVTTEAVQLHGAMGYMRETGIERLMRDAKMLQIVEGANEIQKGIIARALLKS